MTENVWKAHPGPQELLEANPAFECLFGGTKGPGKTETILREATRQTEKERYRAVIFRRTFPRLGEIIDRSFKYFPRCGAKYSDKDMHIKLPAWTFPSGAKIAFSHCQREQDKYDHQGKEWHYMGFDQLEEFTETQYLFLLAQIRKTDPDIRCYVRSTANPGGVGHSFVKKRFIDQDITNKIKYFKRIEDDDVECDPGDPDGTSRSFVPATVEDNPSIMLNDPGYVARLKLLPESDQQALLYGNWDVFAGQFFKMWRKHIHVKDYPINSYFSKFISLDYGYSNPSSVGWWQVDMDGNLHRYRELYTEGKTYEQLAGLIMEKTPSDELIEYVVADPAIWGDKMRHRDSMQGESGAETMMKVFGSWTKLIKGDNNRVTGWGRMRILLEPVTPLGRKPYARLTVASICRDFIRTVPALVHDENKPEDLNTEGEDHTADETRYAVMSRPEPGELPKEEPKVWNTIDEWERQEELQSVRE